MVVSGATVHSVGVLVSTGAAEAAVAAGQLSSLRSMSVYTHVMNIGMKK